MSGAAAVVAVVGLVDCAAPPVEPPPVEPVVAVVSEEVPAADPVDADEVVAGVVPAVIEA